MTVYDALVAVVALLVILVLLTIIIPHPTANVKRLGVVFILVYYIFVTTIDKVLFMWYNIAVISTGRRRGCFDTTYKGVLRC